jgi:hypothetical protein
MHVGIVLGLGGLLALVAFLAGGKARGEPLDRLPEWVQKVIANPHATKTELELAAEWARTNGYPKLAEALDERARTARQTRPLIESPWKDISSDKWTDFARVMGGNPVDYVSPKNYYGIFALGVRRLVDLGIMTNPRKEGPPPGIWQGDWAIPKEEFLAQPRLQYNAFAKSMAAYRKLVEVKYPQAVGTVFDGQKATLSGLLAVAHNAGGEGLGRWLANDPPREKFPATNQAYRKANGIF